MDSVFFPVGPCVLALVALAAAWDWQTRRIPNWLVASALLVALPVQCWLHGGIGGLQIWFAGAMAGGMLLLPGYLLRVVGAGDVKLMAAVGALCGATLAVEVAVVASLVGGLWSLAMLWQRGQIRAGLSGTFSLLLTMAGGCRQSGAQNGEVRAVTLGRMPFGVAIAAGTVFTVMTSIAGS
jgi:prepilin peptidase CpaA